MKELLENKLQLGNGIYTIQEISQLLQIPYHRATSWISKYWNGELGQVYEYNHSWQVDHTKAVGFHTFVEFYVMMQFAESGVNISQVLEAHRILSTELKTPFPFAQKQVLENISTDGKKIYLRKNGDTITLDGSRQLNLDFIKMFFKRLDFGKDLLASRFWPMGKEKGIVCDPNHRFGQAVIEGTNIQAEAIYRMHLATEPLKFIAELYSIPIKKVEDAVAFYNSAA